MDRVDLDNSQAPVECWLFQSCASGTQVCPVVLVPADFYNYPPVPARLMARLLKHQREGGTCWLSAPDRAPFTFFANRCRPKGNGTIDVIGIDYDPHAPLRLWARWRLGARTVHRDGPVRLFYQEPRIVKPVAGPLRYYPGDGCWRSLAIGGPGCADQVTWRCGGYVHLLWSVPPLPPPPSAVAPPSAGWPVYHSGLLELPIDGLLERICATRAARPSSVLTFDRTKKPW